jgi:acyl carrier protein
MIQQKQNPKERLEALIRKLGFRVDFNSKISDSMDSLDIAELIIEIETEFEIDITEADEGSIITFNDLLALIGTRI